VRLRALAFLLVLATRAAAQNGVEDPTSDTPLRHPDFIHENPQRGHFKFRPKKKGGPTPYNCLAHAKGHDDVWIQPGTAMTTIKGGKGAQTATMAQIMADNGCALLACATPPEDTTCPAGAQLVWLVYHLAANAPVPRGLPADHLWVHAMRKAPDGWTSKNGDYTKHDQVPDPHQLVDDQYPPYPGEQEVIRCACCPIPAGSGTVVVPTTITQSTITTTTTTTTTIPGLAVLLSHQLSTDFPVNAVVCLNRITDSHVAGHQACPGDHLHAHVPSVGILILRNGVQDGRFPDPDSLGCGYGLVFAYHHCPPP
jgi:hypothetical protein